MRINIGGGVFPPLVGGFSQINTFHGGIFRWYILLIFRPPPTPPGLGGFLANVFVSGPPQITLVVKSPLILIYVFRLNR